MTVSDHLPMFLTRSHLSALAAPLGLTADGLRSVPGFAEAAEVRLSPKRPRFRRDAVLAFLGRLEATS
ncbi:MAG: hypothetical protein ACOH2M_10230 [Cypionkella sp.]